jgi:hypothetical protein
MPKRRVSRLVEFPLKRAFTFVEPGPVLLISTAHLECRVVNRDLASEYNFFVLQGIRPWSNPVLEDTLSFHAVGNGTFIIDGEIVNLRHRMTKWQDCI